MYYVVEFFSDDADGLIYVYGPYYNKSDANQKIAELNRPDATYKVARYQDAAGWFKEMTGH